MKDIISGLKKFVHMHQVKTLRVPQYETLKMTVIIEQALGMPEVMKHLPILKELEKVPKAWCCNVIFSVVGDQFEAWVYDRIRARNERVTAIRDLNINVDPRVLAAF